MYSLVDRSVLLSDIRLENNLKVIMKVLSRNDDTKGFLKLFINDRVVKLREMHDDPP